MRLAAALLLAAAVSAHPGKPVPSRPADKDCSWTRLSDRALGLELFAPKCDYGLRRISEPVIRVYGKKADESVERDIARLFISKLSRGQRRRCIVQSKPLPYLDGKSKRAYVIAPDAALAAESEKKARGDIPEPPCGDRGESADGISYFEYHPNESRRRFAFVDAGQEEHPLFDEGSLTFLP